MGGVHRGLTGDVKWGVFAQPPYEGGYQPPCAGGLSTLVPGGLKPGVSTPLHQNHPIRTPLRTPPHPPSAFFTWSVEIDSRGF